MPQQGTAIAGALQEARRVLEGGARGAAGKAVLLITDGEDNEGAALTVSKRSCQVRKTLSLYPTGEGSRARHVRACALR